MSSCVAPIPLDRLIAESRRNEIAAHRMAAMRDVQVSGQVVDITFLRDERKVTVSQFRAQAGSLSSPLGNSAVTSTGAQGSMSTETKRVRSRNPYVELVAEDGTRVFCFVGRDAHVDALSVGRAGVVFGIFSDIERDPSGIYVVTLGSCRAPPKLQPVAP